VLHETGRRRAASLSVIVSEEDVDCLVAAVAANKWCEQMLSWPKCVADGLTHIVQKVMCIR
jgi:hypothetical protein